MKRDEDTAVHVHVHTLFQLDTVLAGDFRVTYLILDTERKTDATGKYLV